MIVQVVSFVIEGHVLDFPLKGRFRIVSDIVNDSKADLLVFPGWTLDKKNDIQKLLAQLENKKTTVFFEWYDRKRDELDAHNGYVLHKGRLIDQNVRQIFSSAKCVEKKDDFIDYYLGELESKRLLKIGARKALWLSCGEINILKNKQAEGNKVVFRSTSKVLTQRFNASLKKSDFIINPIHTPMGNQGKLSKRRVHLTRKDKVYISTCNVEVKDGRTISQLLKRKLQYVVKIQKEITPFGSILSEKNGFVSNLYEI